LIRIPGNVVLARSRRIDEFYFNIRSYSLDVAIPPHFEGIRCGRPSTLVGRPVIGSAVRVRFDLVRLAIHYVDAPAVGLPPGYARRVMFVRILLALVVLIFVFILRCIGIRVPSLPEDLYELITFLVGSQRIESTALILSDDVWHILFYPPLVYAL